MKEFAEEKFADEIDLKEAVKRVVDSLGQLRPQQVQLTKSYVEGYHMEPSRRNKAKFFFRSRKEGIEDQIFSKNHQDIVKLLMSKVENTRSHLKSLVLGNSQT